jgi:hypothetical protein
MRVYFTTTVARSRETLKSGFTDLYAFGDQRGVWVGREPLDINDGFEGDVVLCLDVPDDVFERYEMSETRPDTGQWFQTGRAIIPAAVLNRHGPAQIYDHNYAGLSRRELVQFIRNWEQGSEQIQEITLGREAIGIEEEGATARRVEGIKRHVAEMRDAIAFFDEIGWLTPLKVREQQQGT